MLIPDDIWNLFEVSGAQFGFIAVAMPVIAPVLAILAFPIGAFILATREYIYD